MSTAAAVVSSEHDGSVPEELVQKVIMNPYGLVEHKFQVAMQARQSQAGDLSRRNPDGIPEGDWGIPDEFRRVFSTPGALAKIPIMKRSTLDRLRPGQLVRFRGMVQDLIEYNMYCPAMWRTERSGPNAGKKSLVCAKYRDVPARPDDEATSASSLARRFSAYLVPIPGESGWARSASLGSDRPKSRRSEEDIKKAAEMLSKRGSRKRKARDGEDELERRRRSGPSSVASASGAATGASEKSSTSASSAAMTASDADGGEEGASSAKRARGGCCSHGGSCSRCDGQGCSHSGPGEKVDAPLPLEAFSPTPGSERELPCLARMYDADVEPTPLKIGQVVEVIGIYTYDPLLSMVSAPGQPRDASSSALAPVSSGSESAHLKMKGYWEAPNEASMHEEATFRGIPVGSLVPRLQVMSWRNLSSAFPVLQPAPGAVPAVPAVPREELAKCKTTEDAARIRLPASAHAPFYSFQPARQDDPAKRAAEFVKAGGERVMKAAERTGGMPRALIRKSGMEEEQATAIAAARSLVQAPQMPQAALRRVRDESIRVLQAAVGGDSLAAEFLLLNLISRVVSRPTSGPVGALPLNIMGCPELPVDFVPEGMGKADEPSGKGEMPSSGAGQGGEEEEGADDPSNYAKPVLPLDRGASPAGRRVAMIIKAIRPRASLIPMRLDNMNSLRLAPMKDHVAERFLAGALQLSEGTSVVLDQTVMGRGPVGSRANGNLVVLRKLAAEAVLCCDCGFGSSVELPVDFPTVMLSGPRAMLHEHFTVVGLSEVARTRLADEAKAGSKAPPAPPADVLRRVRKYLAIVRSLPFHISESLDEKIRSDIVAIRGADRTVQAEDLHRLMTLTRLISASLGEETVSLESWKRANAMERARRARLPAYVRRQMQEQAAKVAKQAAEAKAAMEAMKKQQGGLLAGASASASAASSSSGRDGLSLSAAEEELLKSVMEGRPVEPESKGKGKGKAGGASAMAGDESDDTDDEDEAFGSAATPKPVGRAGAGAGVAPAGVSVGRGGPMGRNLTPEEAFLLGRQRRQARAGAGAAQRPPATGASSARHEAMLRAGGQAGAVMQD